MKQKIIQKLTDLMATIQCAYYKGRMEGHRHCVHERTDDSAAISIDLYHFCGDGLPVCDGLKPCTITYDDGTTDTGWVFCMCYDPDDVQQLAFLFSPEDDRPDMETEPESIPEQALQNIVQWLEGQFK